MWAAQRRLGHVKDANPLGHGNRRALEVDTLQEGFIWRSRRACGVRRHDFDRSKPAQARSFERGEKDHR